MNPAAASIATTVLRIALAALFLWFGLTQLAMPIDWTGWVPAWVSVLHLEPNVVVMLNGAFEVIAGAFLAFGMWVRPIAILLALHLAIIVLHIGVTAIGVRDFGLVAACIALGLLGPDRLSFDAPRPRFY